MSGFSFLEFFQQIINGLTLGSIYALIAIGYTMVYGIIGMINFAHGEIYMIGAYVGLMVITGLGLFGVHSITAILLVTLAISILVTGSYGWTVERLAYRPLRGSPRLVPLISAIGVSIFLQNYVQIGQGARDVSMQPVLTGGWRFGPEGGFQVYVSYMQVLIAVITVAFMSGLTLFIGRSRMGRACRACSEDRGMANLLGIDTDRVIALTFVLGAALAAVAGVLVSMYYGLVNPFIGFIAGLKSVYGGGAGRDRQHSRRDARWGGAGAGGELRLRLSANRIQGRGGVRAADSGAAGATHRPVGSARRGEGVAMPRALSDALLAAALTAVLLTPIFGLHIRVDGVNVSLNRTPMPVIVAVAIVFLLRLFQQPLQRLWAKLHPADAWRSNPLATGLRSVTERPNTRLALWLLLLAAAMIWAVHRLARRGGRDDAGLDLRDAGPGG
jgi:branched-chain amino acid transport system permease protein